MVFGSGIKEAGVMLTRLTVRNFKRFQDAEIELGNPVVFIGPNDSGKTTALQALALWDLGLRRWKEKRSEKQAPEKRPGVTMNRRDLLAVPVPHADLLWRGLRTRRVQRWDGKQGTQNIRIEIVVAGVNAGRTWSCGLEFDYANVESFYCRPLRLGAETKPARMPIPEDAYQVKVAFLPPMSGLAANETRLDMGAINVRLGEGRTAEVLRNLCYLLAADEEQSGRWQQLRERMEGLFPVTLDQPVYIAERGEVEMTYRDATGTRLDLSCSGRGLQQTLLLLAHLALNPGSVLLLDEPDAHLEILRQAEIYQLLTAAAREQDSQIIIASHSEVVLREASEGQDHQVVAFLGRPHPITRNADQLRKSLTDVRFDQYYLAEQTGWVLYLEGSTDLNVLRAFADRLNHPAREKLQRVFLHPIGNQPVKGRNHFYALREAKTDLVAFLLADRDVPDLQPGVELVQRKWKRREVENYLCQPETLLAWASEFGRASAAGPLFEQAGTQRTEQVMRKCIEDRVPPAALRNRNDSWWSDVKASDDFLERVFEDFFQGLGLYQDFSKADYYRLVKFIPEELIDSEVVQALDDLLQVAERATPAEKELPQEP